MSDLVNWRAVKEPLGYNDGTTHRWQVEATGYDSEGAEVTVQLADWLTEHVAKRIAQAEHIPALGEALKALIEAHERSYDPIHKEVIAQARVVISLLDSGETVTEEPKHADT